ncbi:ankyrin repeat domain-containing protein SOWAHB [Rhea pennata]|uniref:ankyrin repeat domain-containing protein SOWAHB n=1 Tax=Rhea pennata TaxID=8795 RepID=UPI002E253EBF
MARELSQEAVLDFLWGAGGSAPNAALLRHFERFLRDPALPAAQRRQRRDRFKRLVNSLATVRPAAAPGASKDIVLRRRYRDLLGEEQLRPQQQPEPHQSDEEREREREREPPPPRDRPRQRRRSPALLPAPREPPLLGPKEPPPSHSLLPRSGPKEPPPSQSLLPPPGPKEPPPSQSLLPPPGLKESPPPQSLLPRSGPKEPTPSQSLLPPSGPKELPPNWSLLRPSGPKEPPISRSLPPPSGTRALFSTELPRSLPLSLAGPPPYRIRSPPGPGGPPPSHCLLPPVGPRVLPCSRPSHSRSLPPLQSPLPTLVPGEWGSPECSPPATLPVFRSIRCQLALLEVQGTPSSPPEEAGGLPYSLPPESLPKSLPGRGPSVPLGRREHTWLVAVSAGRWAQVQGLFLEEPQLALWRDFVSGFTALHWLAKHGDGQGLRELAAAAQEAGLVLDVDARSGCGYTPLHLAAMHGHQIAIKVLVLQLGCRVRIRDSSGRRPWEYLGSSTSGEIWQLLEAPRGKVIFPTQPLARSVSSVSKASLPAGRTSLPACLKPQCGPRAAPHRRDGD